MRDIPLFSRKVFEDIQSIIDIDINMSEAHNIAALLISGQQANVTLAWIYYSTFGKYSGYQKVAQSKLRNTLFDEIHGLLLDKDLKYAGSSSYRARVINGRLAIAAFLDEKIIRNDEQRSRLNTGYTIQMRIPLDEKHDFVFNTRLCFDEIKDSYDPGKTIERVSLRIESMLSQEGKYSPNKSTFLSKDYCITIDTDCSIIDYMKYYFNVDLESILDLLKLSQAGEIVWEEW